MRRDRIGRTVRTQRRGPSLKLSAPQRLHQHLRQASTRTTSPRTICASGQTDAELRRRSAVESRDSQDEPPPSPRGGGGPLQTTPRPPNPRPTHRARPPLGPPPQAPPQTPPGATNGGRGVGCRPDGGGLATPPPLPPPPPYPLPPHPPPMAAPATSRLPGRRPHPGHPRPPAPGGSGRPSRSRPPFWCFRASPFRPGRRPRGRGFAQGRAGAAGAFSGGAGEGGPPWAFPPGPGAGGRGRGAAPLPNRRPPGPLVATALPPRSPPGASHPAGLPTHAQRGTAWTATPRPPGGVERSPWKGRVQPPWPRPRAGRPRTGGAGGAVTRVFQEPKTPTIRS